jgi:hypothetical protein
VNRRFGIGFGNTIYTFGLKRPFVQAIYSEDFTVFFGWWSK